MALPAQAATTNSDTWTQYEWNSGNSISPVASFNTQPVTMNFHSGKFTALLTSSSKKWTGDLTGKTLTDNGSVQNVTGTFVTQNGGGCGNPPAVRLYFTSPGFADTHFWWSNPVNYVLQNGSFTLSVPTDPSQWSDFNGRNGDTEVSGFQDAVKKVSTVGLSFGGDCFFENGATTTDGTGSLTSQFSD
jgi:hypothetical protein